MAKSNWAAVSFDVLKQVFERLPEWSRGHGVSKLPQYLLVCKDWVIPARRWLHGACLVAMVIGPHCHRLVFRLSCQASGDKGTEAQLQVVLNNCSSLCSLEVVYSPGLSTEALSSLIHFQQIRCLDFSVNHISSLESVHTLTHLDQLKNDYDGAIEEEDVPHLACTRFSRLTSLEVETGWQEPLDTFLYLTQLQTLRHLSLSTAAPTGFNYAALSLLTRLHMDNIDLDNLEGLQGLPQLVDLDLLGHPSDADILMLANLTS